MRWTFLFLVLASPNEWVAQIALTGKVTIKVKDVEMAHDSGFAAMETTTKENDYGSF